MKPFKKEHSCFVDFVLSSLFLFLRFFFFHFPALSTFPPHLLSKPNFLAFGAFWFFCCCCLDCCCCVFYLCFWGWFSFFCLCLLFWFEIMTTNAVFPAILGFFKGVLLSVIQKKGLLQFERCFAPFSPQSPFFKNTLGLSFSLFFSSVFPFKIPCFFCSSPPFEIIILVCCLALSLSHLSFLQLCFFPSNKFPDIPFLNPPCFHFLVVLALMFFIFEWYCLQVWCFLLCFSCWFLFGILLIVVVTFLFNTGIFFFCCFLSSFCGVCCFGFSLWHRKKVFSLRFWWVFGGGCAIPVWVRMFC